MTSWDEPRKEEVKRLFGQGYSATQIAAHLSAEWREEITRNSIIGIRHRMGLSEPFIGPRKPRERRQPKERAKLPRAERRLEQMPRPPIAMGIPFLDRAPHQCPFPVEGEGLTMLCCGADRYRYGGGTIKRTWLPYCHYHCHVAFRWARPVDEGYAKAADFAERLTGRPDAC